VLRLLLLCVLLATCGPRQTTDPATRPSSASQQAAHKRIVAGIRSNPAGLYAKLTTSRYTSAPIEGLVNVGFSALDDQLNLQPRLAEAVPTLENGLWKVAPDGRMEITWTLRPGIRWHDGTPFTAEDAVFTTTVVQDERLPDFGDSKYRFLEKVEAKDSRTVVSTWKQPFIEADRLFTTDLGMLVPRHLLEPTYHEDPSRFLDLPYWSHEFIGTGPYKLRDWVLGSHLVVEANDQYVLGRPKIDLIEVRFITETAGLTANILAGAVELTLGTTGLSLEQAIEVRDRWTDGKVHTAPANLRRLSPQLMTPNPAVIGDVQFRRALLYAVDRQEIIDTLEGGLTSVPLSFLPPNRPEFREVEANIPRYDFDPRRAMQLIEELGYSRAGDGSFRERSGGPLRVEIRTTAGDDNQTKIMFAVGDFWERVGVGVDPVLVPPQQTQDRQAQATRPAFWLSGSPSGLEGLANLHSSQVPTADNNWVGANFPRYANAEYDALYERYLVTIPRAERMQVLSQALHHIATQLPVLGVYYRVAPTMITNRLVGVGPVQVVGHQAWNAHEWDLTR